MSFVPLSQLQARERVSLALPEYVPQDQIALNLERLGALAFIGGFAKNVAITSFANETARRLPHNRPPLTIVVDTDNVAQRISQAKENLRDPGAWADQLHGTITRQLRQASWDHYICNPRYSELIPVMAVNMFSGSWIDSQRSAQSAKVNAFLDRFVPAAKRVDKECFSLFPVIHPDAGLLMAGLSRALKVAKKIP